MKAKRPKKPKPLQPADVLQTRMEYYNKLARTEMRKGTLGDVELIEKYLKLAQDAAKELAPYLHGKAQVGDNDEAKKHYVMRLNSAQFESVEEWMFYYKVVAAQELDDPMRQAGEELNRKMIKADFWKNNEKDHIQKWWDTVRSGGDPNKIH